MSMSKIRTSPVVGRRVVPYPATMETKYHAVLQRIEDEIYNNLMHLCA